MICCYCDNDLSCAACGHEMPEEMGIEALDAATKWKARALAAEAAIQASSEQSAAAEAHADEYFRQSVRDQARLAEAVKVIQTEQCPFKDGPMADGWAEAWATFLQRLTGADAEELNALFANSRPVERQQEGSK